MSSLNHVTRTGQKHSFLPWHFDGGHGRWIRVHRRTRWAVRIRWVRKP